LYGLRTVPTLIQVKLDRVRLGYEFTMDFILRTVALCHDGLSHVQGTQGALPVSLFLVALAGSAVHCAGMCGPFVLGQVVADAGKATRRYGEWRRLAGAALIPYHLGRLTTYTGLGAVAGSATALFATTSVFGLISGALLVIGASFMLFQAFGLATSIHPHMARLLRTASSTLSTSHRPFARYALGIVLGFLPCGLIYGALGVAAGSGSAWSGALAMAAFALGTMPGLVAVGWGGMFVRRQLRDIGRWVIIPILLANAIFMLALAGERFVNTVSS
jgi:sulfite exporter TauE/SafE